MTELSKCCNALVTLEMCDETPVGTEYYLCPACGKSCDVAEQTKMKLYVDSSITEACWQFEGELPVRYEHIPEPETHNVAEYKAVELALNVCLALSYKNVEVFTDSQLVAGQVTKNWKVNAKHLLKHVLLVKEMLRATNSTLSWIPRERNLAGIELDKRRKL